MKHFAPKIPHSDRPLNSKPTSGGDFSRAEQMASITVVTSEMREAAIRYIARKAPDLLAVLGLDTPVRKPRVVQPPAQSARRVAVRSIDCPECHALSGEKCVSRNNLRQATSHTARFRMLRDIAEQPGMPIEGDQQ